MELDRKLYQKTFSHLKASPDLGKAVVELEEKRRKPKRFLMRRALVAAAVLALAFALALGANAASGGGLFGPLQSIAMFFADGEQVVLDCTRDADGKLPARGNR